jgi:MSHA pilin protein MshA
MKKVQAGFTLIELVVVIVLLGILAAVAIPKFVDLSGEANTAAMQGVAGGVSSAMAINYAACAALNNATSARCISVKDCSTATVGTILTGGVPTGYTFAGTPASVTNGAEIACTITKTGVASGTAMGIVAGQP